MEPFYSFRNNDSIDRTPVPDDLKDFYKDWAKEIVKETFKTANTYLGQILTLSTALFGGTIAFWNNIPVSNDFKYIVIFCLLINIIVGLISATPSVGGFDPKNQDDIKRHVLELYYYKQKRIKFSRNTLIACVTIMAIGLFDTSFHIQDRMSNLYRYVYQYCSHHTCDDTYSYP